MPNFINHSFLKLYLLNLHSVQIMIPVLKCKRLMMFCLKSSIKVSSQSSKNFLAGNIYCILIDISSNIFF